MTPATTMPILHLSQEKEETQESLPSHSPPRRVSADHCSV